MRSFMACVLALSISGLPGILTASENERDDLEVPELTPEQIQVAEDVFGISSNELFQVSLPMTKEKRREVEREVERDLQQLTTMAQRTDQSIGILVKYTSWVLKRKGHADLANQFQTEYEARYTKAVFFYAMGIAPADLGDHPPLWEWLDTFYNKIEGVLGEELCKMLRIYDLKIINYTIPVVFNPKGKDGNTWDQADYKIHFAGKMKNSFSFEHHGLAGVVSYWITWAVCTGATFGAGAVTFICSPIGMVAEFSIDKWVAPPLADKIYCKANEC